jgi:hypothetical protein
MNKTLLKQYIDSGYSSYKIANISNKGQTTIRYWLKKYNLFTKGNKRDTKIINGDTHIKCGNCDKFYSKDNFYKKTKNLLNSYCKNCFNEYAKERWKARKRKAIEYKGGKCSSCGYNKCPDVLEFHHRDPKQKEFDWKKLRQMSWDKVTNELDKCDLLCSNCHRERHYEIFSLNKK